MKCIYLYLRHHIVIDADLNIRCDETFKEISENNLCYTFDSEHMFVLRPSGAIHRLHLYKGFCAYSEISLGDHKNICMFRFDTFLFIFVESVSREIVTYCIDVSNKKQTEPMKLKLNTNKDYSLLTVLTAANFSLTAPW